MSAPRIAPGGLRETGPIAWGFARIAQRAMGTKEPPRIFTTLGRHPGLFRGWLFFAGRLMPRGKLPRRDTELVILRVAHLRACAYEWEHHVVLGRRAGLDAQAIERVKAGADAPGWSPRDRTLLRAVDELHASGDVTDETWSALREHLDDRRLIELVMLTAHYEMLATTIGTLRIQPDAKKGTEP